MIRCHHCGSDDSGCDWKIIDADPPCLDMQRSFFDEDDNRWARRFYLKFFIGMAVIAGIILFALINVK